MAEDEGGGAGRVRVGRGIEFREMQGAREVCIKQPADGRLTF